MGISATSPETDLYVKLAAMPASADPRLTLWGTGTYTLETVDEDRATDRTTGLPLK